MGRKQQAASVRARFVRLVVVVAITALGMVAVDIHDHVSRHLVMQIFVVGAPLALGVGGLLIAVEEGVRRLRLARR